jgi:hypothetical protein
MDKITEKKVKEIIDSYSLLNQERGNFYQSAQQKRLVANLLT